MAEVERKQAPDAAPEPAPEGKAQAEETPVAEKAKDEPAVDTTQLLAAKIAELQAAPETAEEEARKILRNMKKSSKELKSQLESCSGPEEQVKLLHKTYFEQLRETQRLDKEILNLSRKCDNLKRDRDNASSELSKATTMKSKLEVLCKELQKQNKLVQAESRRVAETEHQKRQELSEKFQTTINDISDKMDAQGDERGRQVKENEMLREKLTSFSEQLELREKQWEHKLHAKDLEKQLEEAKAKHQEEVAKQAEAKAAAYSAQAEAQARTEADLREQLALYGDKFEQFKDTLTKSNEIFATYKKEMDKLTKRNRELEKENATVKKTAAKKEAALVQLLGEKKLWTKEQEALKGQRDKLEKLCRGMTLERNGMRETIRQLKGGGDTSAAAAVSGAMSPLTPSDGDSEATAGLKAPPATPKDGTMPDAMAETAAVAAVEAATEAETTVAP